MKVIKKISTISGYASGVLIALIWALMIAEVIMRNIFHHPILGCSEICVFMYVSASYFGFPLRRSIRATLPWICFTQI